ncbi:Holliday junction resolvase RuvX [Patescibacteria group bacterium]
MKYLGIDYGIKNVGIAISDENGTMAFPKTILKNNSSLVSDVLALVKEDEVEEIVIGESLNYKGQPNLIMKKIIPFKKSLEDSLGKKVFFEPEFLTSLEAEKTQGRKDKLDSSAAALILKSFLDRKNNAQIKDKN